MKKVLLIHQNKIQHYRISIYEYFHSRFYEDGVEFHVTSEDVDSQEFKFKHYQSPTKLVELIKLIDLIRPTSVVLFVNMRVPCLVPIMLYLRMKGIKCIFWSHGANLQNPESILNYVYYIPFLLCTKIQLYSAESVSRLIPRFLLHKASHANNTLMMSGIGCMKTPSEIKAEFSISEKYIVISVGRIEERKQIPSLIKTSEYLKNMDVAIVVVGPVSDPKVVSETKDGIYFTGPLYGQTLHDLMNASDIYCLPGAVGLSIVDSFYFGLPFITRSKLIVNHGPEVDYLKNGFNGFLIEEEGVLPLARKIKQLVENPTQLKALSNGALETYASKAHVSNMYEVFRRNSK